MKMAKIFAIMFALFLAVFCFNGPFALGGDEHPWDEEDDNGGGFDGTNPDPDNGTDDPTNIGSGTAIPETQSDGKLIFDLFTFSLVASTVF